MKRCFKALVAAAALAAGAAQAYMVSFTPSQATITDLGSGNYSFSVGGFSDGGTVTGSFSGVDANNDLWLSSGDAEISAISVFYSGGAAIPAFSLASPALVFGQVNYMLDGGLLGDAPGELIIMSNGLTAAFYLFNGIFPCDGTSECGLIEHISAVPETGSLPLMLAGLGAAAAVTRRRRSQR